MDITEIGVKLMDLIKKYRYVILVLLIGIGLMLIPSGADKKEAQSTEPTIGEQKRDLSEDLASVLSQIKGAGKVRVYLSCSAGEKTIYQSDQDSTTNAESGSVRNETVIVMDADRSQQALVQQVLSPTYQGAIVLCQGADDASVRLAIVEAVANVTGLRTDRISVLKMK